MYINTNLSLSPSLFIALAFTVFRYVCSLSEGHIGQKQTVIKFR